VTALESLRGVAYIRPEVNLQIQCRDLQPNIYDFQSSDIDMTQTSPTIAPLWPASDNLDGYFDYENLFLMNTNSLAASYSSAIEMDDSFLLVSVSYSTNRICFAHEPKALQQMGNDDPSKGFGL
jgi:hypothetical protein